MQNLEHPDHEGRKILIALQRGFILTWNLFSFINDLTVYLWCHLDNVIINKLCVLNICFGSPLDSNIQDINIFLKK